MIKCHPTRYFAEGGLGVSLVAGVELTVHVDDGCLVDHQLKRLERELVHVGVIALQSSEGGVSWTAETVVGIIIEGNILMTNNGIDLHSIENKNNRSKFFQLFFYYRYRGATIVVVFQVIIISFRICTD